MWTKQPNSDLCFVCGLDNPVGLQLTFWQSADRVRSRCQLPEPYQSWPNIGHGGVISALLDEVMARAVIGLHDAFAVSVKLALRFHDNTPLNEPLVVEGWVERRRGTQWFFTAAELRHGEDDRLLASATATFTCVPPNQAAHLHVLMAQWPTHEPEVRESAP
ncbi:MAG: PaaI family thioesterase [Anaerolineales bacterium]|nr:PaaI family thioesterase [Anaerolineales bacterium]MCB9127763.1 PaaI family thioesterase [Ardenticatenales bacterium]